MENTLKTINYYTEKRGVNPVVRESVKSQALTMANIDLSNFTKVGDYMVMPIAIDGTTGETLYLKVSTTVGALPTETKRKKSVKTSEPVEVPSLF